MVQVITQKSATSTPDKPIKVITKKRAPATAKKPTQPAKQEPTQAVAKESGRTFAIEPVRPMGQQSVSHTTQPYSRFSFKTPGGKKESIPVITQYSPNQSVYPYGKIDRHIHGRWIHA